MRGRTRGMAAAAITSLALIATACGGGGTEPEPGAEDPAGQAGGEIAIRSCTPQNPLIPANTNEVCGGNMLDAITAKLVHYNTETRCTGAGHRRVDRVQGQPDVHGEAQAGLQVP